MAGNNSQPEFGFDDFRRYHNGEMSAQEQHNLEKRMLEEPLVAEAYEGFLALTEDKINYESALENLRETLKEKAKPRGRRTLPIWAYASAASVVLALGLYWLGFVLNENTGNKRVAFEMSVDKPDHATAAQEETTIKETPSPTAAFKPIPQKVLGNVPAITSKPEPAESVSLPTEELKLSKNKLEDAVAQHDQEQISVVESLPASESTAAAPTAAAPTAAAPTAVAPAAAAPAQVLSQKSAAKVSKNYAAGASATIPASRPAPRNGWESYHSYLMKNSVSEKLGDVEVTFMVNADSTLSAFSTKGEPLLYEKAILTVKNGPVWVPAKSNGREIGMLVTIQLRFRYSN